MKKLNDKENRDQFNLKKKKFKFPICISKVYDNADCDDINTKGVFTPTDDFPILGSGKSKCYKSHKPISKMIFQ